MIMKNVSFFTFITMVSVLTMQLSCSMLVKTDKNQRTRLFDEGWRFIKDNPAGAEDPVFDDSKWRTVDLPHDWSIEDLPDQKEGSVVGPFSKAAVGQLGTGFTVGGTAWYRKSFTIDKADKDKTTYLQFDGVYMNSDVWINGKHVGNHPNGYTSFYYDITPFLNPPGQPNTVAVQVKNEGKNSRWYSGSGIYRHTWLTMVNPVHIEMWGVYVTTPVVNEKSAEINLMTALTNSGKENAPVTMQVQIIDPSGKIVGVSKNSLTLSSGQTTELKQSISIESPALWSTEDPELYQARATVFINKKEVDDLKTAFGIRSIKFDAATGFTLNGKSMELKGGCFHHDNGPLGSATIDRAEERKIELLKDAGFNAIRCSHNPPSPYLLDVCDRLGMLVIDEFSDMWSKPKVSPDDYAKYFKSNWKLDISSIVIRDRNHPSVIMWSIGNEIPESADTAGLRIAKNLADEVRRFDSTRAVTEAIVDFSSLAMLASDDASAGAPPASVSPAGGPPANGMPDFSALFKTGIDIALHMALLDVVGYNYAYQKYEVDHKKYPDRVIYGSETFPPNSLENWQIAEKLPYVIGNFTWTAMDYMGESGFGYPRLIPADSKINKMLAIMTVFMNPDSWPIFNAFLGDLDLIGNPKTPYYYQHVVWRDSKIEMFVHRPVPAGKKELTSLWGFPDELKSWSWTGHEGEKMQVHVYTRSKLVKLELNGKILGEQNVDDSKSITATFEVPYEPGTLTARCYDNGVETASETIKTVGKPAVIRLTADRSTIKASRNDLSYVMVEVTDADGNVIPYANDTMINFEISGNGEIAGVGNSNPIDLSSFQQPRKTTFQGKCLAIVRPKGLPGKIILKAKSEGLKECSLEILTE
jgi:beta-galactosidase